MVHGYRGIRRVPDGNYLHGVCLAQSVSVRAMNAAAIGGERPPSNQRGRAFHSTPRRDLILYLGSAAAPDRACAAAIAR